MELLVFGWLLLGGVGQSWILENWGFNLVVLGSFLSSKKVYHCKFPFHFLYFSLHFTHQLNGVHVGFSFVVWCSLRVCKNDWQANSEGNLQFIFGNALCDWLSWSSIYVR
jgi:hypothetical protein